MLASCCRLVGRLCSSRHVCMLSQFQRHNLPSHPSLNSDLFLLYLPSMWNVVMCFLYWKTRKPRTNLTSASPWTPSCEDGQQRYFIFLFSASVFFNYIRLTRLQNKLGHELKRKGTRPTPP